MCCRFCKSTCSSAALQTPQHKFVQILSPMGVIESKMDAAAERNSFELLVYLTLAKHSTIRQAAAKALDIIANAAASRVRAYYNPVDEAMVTAKYLKELNATRTLALQLLQSPAVMGRVQQAASRAAAALRTSEVPVDIPRLCFLTRFIAPASHPLLSSQDVAESLQ